MIACVAKGLDDDLFRGYSKHQIDNSMMMPMMQSTMMRIAVVVTFVVVSSSFDCDLMANMELFDL